MTSLRCSNHSFAEVHVSPSFVIHSCASAVAISLTSEIRPELFIFHRYLLLVQDEACLDIWHVAVISFFLSQTR